VAEGKDAHAFARPANPRKGNNDQWQDGCIVRASSWLHKTLQIEIFIQHVAEQYIHGTPHR